MGKASAKRPPISNGRAPTQKRSDYHFTGPDGSKWDSRFEYIFYTAAKDAGIPIERCEKSDTIPFVLPIRGGSCGACSSTNVGQRRTYTPDFRIVSPDKEHKVKYHYIETKGYLRSKERSLLRNLSKTHPDLMLSVVLQRTYPVGTKRTDGSRSSVVDWFQKFLPGVNVYVWNGTIPEGLFSGVARQSIRAKASKKGKPLRRGSRASDT